MQGHSPCTHDMQALRPAPGGDLCGAGSPSTSRCRRSALHPGEFFAGRQSQPPTMRGVPPLHSPERALRPAPRPTFSRRESRQRYARNLLVPGPPAQGGGPPWIPPPCALAVLVEGKKVCGILGGRRGRCGCRYPFLYSGKNCWMPGGEHRPYMADRGRLGCSCNESNESTELS